MKYLILIVIGLFSASAHAQEVNRDGYVELPGNAYYKPGGGGENVYIYRRYGRDNLRRELLNPYLAPRRSNNMLRFPSDDFAEICGNVTTQNQRRKCRSDVMNLNKDRAQLYRKYN